MALLQHPSHPPVDPASPPVDTASPPVDASPPTASDDVVASPTPRRVPRTRAGAAWFGICIAAATLVVLIVFMLQNTRSVEVNFLWMHGNLPLALGLLIAGVGTAIVVMVIGAFRMTQLRRRSRRP